MSDPYDYIIVGAGSAGCVLANRLSADPSKRVLLLEAGGRDDHFLLRMPLGFLRALFDPKLTWPFVSEPEPHLNGRQIPLPRGRVLGGSSSINGMFFMRGHSLDFDTWRQLGCEGWGFADVLPYFRKMEKSWRGESEWHGADGPLSVIPNDIERLLHRPLIETAKAAGFDTTDDLHGPQEEGFARGELTIDRRGRRASTSRAYLAPALPRLNLKVITGALTHRVEIEGGRAAAVIYAHDGKVERAQCRGEVILSGGAYGSPQLLMLSGIGPAAHLKAHGIEPEVDLPGVGRNLSEHPRVPVRFAFTRPLSFLNELRADRVARSVIRWQLFGTGPFATQVNSCNIIIRSDPALAQPDLQIWSNPIRMDARIWFPLLRPAQAHAMTADVILLHPQSRGRVELRSADPAAAPAITLNIFSEPADFEVARRGIRIVRRIYRTPPQADLTGEELMPGAEVSGQEALDAYIRAQAVVTQHPVGTCAMGIGAMSVVDPKLRVRGVRGLRVVDASVMPTVPGANTNGPTIMIAERAADLILGRTPLPPQDQQPQESRMA